MVDRTGRTSAAYLRRIASAVGPERSAVAAQRNLRRSETTPATRAALPTDSGISVVPMGPVNFNE